ncbi:aliphatic sulfonate ABC transporter substrate-binding protein [Tersicoccus sp. Bi-70]|uniref:aliphatic sulfonate ABC transporter substrate-binding protein n=1 Tax=Tersicoccus sp. Bi-70 TaxID=1897634 RepID=UPI000976348C|nr:aliphatic sulfonate ABC transporter substrate-binding protein [Tersicoccus sp. Bi-70]OMH32290.1 ABC transporter substrate-binding protein [Tersicoccus sp. Bi-70]
MTRRPARLVRSALTAVAVVTAATLTLTGCAGEGSGSSTAAAAGGGGDGKTLNIDFATYNPLSLVIKKKGWLEAALKEKGVTVNWVQSAGSNKANEALRSGAIDVGSTAGSAALLARANGSPIRTVDIYSQPEWSALVTTPKTGITSVADLKGKSVAATKGTDPYFFLLQSLAANGLKASDVTVQNLQHADGRTALENGSVQAWAGLDPIMAAAEKNGAKLFYRNVGFNTYGFLNAREDFLKNQPEIAQTVVNTYEAARAWAKGHTAETAAILADVASIDTTVATKVIARTNLGVDPAPGAKQRAVLEKVGTIIVDSGDVKDAGTVDTALNGLLDADLVTKADPSAVSTK